MSVEPRGCVQVYTGDGKGKTTAAVGLAVRALGAGLRVWFGQLAKGQPTGELQALRDMGERFTARQFGRPVFLRRPPAAEDVALARAGLAEARAALLSGRYDLVVLDEANVAVGWGLFPAEELLALMAARPPGVELVLTGRDADARVVAAADLVTEMRPVKHYADAGLGARRGIEC